MTMTVKELIEELKCFDENEKVWISAAGHILGIGDVDFDDEGENLIIKR